MNWNRVCDYFESCRYTGIFNSFDGCRFWRRQVEEILWQKLGNDFSRSKAIRQLVQTDLKVEQDDLIEIGTHVILSDVTGQQRTETAKISECVRIRPDDWPPYAMPAWERKTKVVGDSLLQSLVHPDDREGLQT